MDTTTDNTGAPQHLTDKEVFTKIWTSPRRVFRYINDTGYDKYFIVLLVLAGISRAFDRASLKNMGDQMSLWAILGICIIVGGLLGWISFYIYAWLVSWTGKWLKGKGNTSSILSMLTYGMIPSAAALIFLVPQIGIYGVELFKEDGDIFSAGLIANIFVYGSMIIELILGIWTIVLCVIGVSETQKLSIGMTILNLLLPVVLLLGVILVLVMIFRVF